MNRKRLLVGGAAAAAPLVVPAAALAKHHMNPKFDPELRVRHDGLVICAEGPLMTEAGMGHAWVATVITQNGRKAHGMSEPYPVGAKRWDALVEVEYGRFRPGRAYAHAVMITVDGEGEVYTYEWSEHVELVHRHPGGLEMLAVDG